MRIVCNPNSPSGSLVDRADLERLAERFPDDVLVVGEGLIYSEGMEEPVARASLTYSIPPRE